MKQTAKHLQRRCLGKARTMGVVALQPACRAGLHAPGFHAQLCYLRFPGVVLAADAPPFAPLLRMVAAQIKVPPDVWSQYSERAETRREHLLELQALLGLKSFTTQHYRPAVYGLDELAWQTDKGIVLAASLVASLRRQSLLLPTADVIERICAEAVTRANRRIHAALTDPLSAAHRQRLDDLHDRIVGKLFNAARSRHQEQFQASGKAINDKVRLYGRIGQALLDAKRSGGDPFAAIETVIPWERFEASVGEALKLAQPEGFDFLHRIGESYATVRRYAP